MITINPQGKVMVINLFPSSAHLDAWEHSHLLVTLPQVQVALLLSVVHGPAALESSRMC